ncbi:MAG: O-antigen ligase family protein [Pseudomonadales bacterium]|nr:O-antigen ligase family protein [Pseudomonadales bacterium]
MARYPDARYYFAAIVLMAISGVLLLTPYYFLAPGLAVAIIGAFVLFARPEWGLLGLIFLVPFEGFFAGSSFLSGSKLIGMALIGVLALRIVFRSSALNNLSTPLWWGVGGLFIVSIVSSFETPYIGLSYNTLRQLVIAIILFVITLTVKERIDFLWVMRALVISVAATSGLAILTASDTGDERSTGLLSDPNYFALLLTTAIPLAIFLIFQSRTSLLRIFWAGSLAVLLVAFVKTFSRSGLVVLALVIATMGWHHQKRIPRIHPRQLVLFFIAGVFGLIVVSIVMPEKYVDRIKSLAGITSGIKSVDDRSLGRRTSYIIVGANALKEHPFFGAGPGTFPTLYAKSGYSIAFNLSEKNPDIFRRAHNTYLEVAAETGLFGIGCFLAAVGLGANNYSRARIIFIRNKDIASADLVTHIGLAYLSVILFLLFLSGTNHKYFWFLLACSHILLGYAHMKKPILKPETTHD